MNHPDITKYQADPEADWRMLPDPVLTAAHAMHYDQATDLPEMGKMVVLPNLGPGLFGFKLSHWLEIDQWLVNVNNILTTYHLNRLIDVRIPRPKRNSPNAENWLNLSMQVAGWLVSNMTTEMYQWIESRGYRIALADELIYVTILACQTFSPLK
ncbi:Shikimate kinase [Penicillium cinerascens]|uniref:Shikimate kinase n=1 Tax=Penicillium cinerascens TaxID=70096 RepID=A0A9W9T034_9EURO|nr:Shikimate kinase [Penicillium cinerascens]KAJ5204513.1 Shikimate kinase [Penicillium cinerascens]